MIEADVIIVGSGPIGAVSATSLAKRGKNVLLLDAVSVPPGAHLRNQQQYQENPDRFFEEIGRWCRFFDPEAPSTGLPGANKTEAVGGQGLIWTNNCPRPTPYLGKLDFLDRNTWEQRLAEAERLLRVQTDLFDDSIRQARVESYLNAQIPERQVTKLPLAAERSQNGTLRFTATKDILQSDPVAASSVTIQHRINIRQIHHTESRVECLIAEDTNGAQESYRAKDYIISIAQIVLKEELSAPEGNPDLSPRLYLPPSSSHPWHAMIARDIFPVPSPEQVHENRLIDMQFFAPIEVREENRMSFDSSSPRFSVQLTKRDEHLLNRMVEDQHELAKLLGRFREGCVPFFLPSGMAHPMGTCRMGSDPSSSVVNGRGQVHGFDNLFVAGAAVLSFPIAINPTLTCAAIALETTDNIS
jgi:C-glycoside oxidase